LAKDSLRGSCYCRFRKLQPQLPSRPRPLNITEAQEKKDPSPYFKAANNETCKRNDTEDSSGFAHYCPLPSWGKSCFLFMAVLVLLQ
jgi:hypothetical protein